VNAHRDEQIMTQTGDERLKIVEAQPMLAACQDYSPVWRKITDPRPGSALNTRI
jgi:hypothetical protein